MLKIKCFTELFVAILVLGFAVSVICLDEDKENYPNGIVGPSNLGARKNDRIPILGKRKEAKKISILDDVVNFLSDGSSIHIENLAKVVKRSYPPSHYPHELLPIMEDAKKNAEAVISSGLKEYQVADFLLQVLAKVKASAKRLDPFNVFSFLYELELGLHRDNIERKPAQKAFSLMARAVMDAPFSAYINNHDKINKGSFDYFKLMAGFFKELDVKQQEGRLTANDYWQIYFNEEAYPYVVPWAPSLYHFYQKEAVKFSLPIGSVQFFDLLNHLEKEDRFYDLEYVTEKEKEYEKTSRDVRFLDWLGEQYLITDIDIYWRAMAHLAGKSQEQQRNFLVLMLSKGADPFTIVDAAGNTPLSLAKSYGLSEIENEISKLKREVALSKHSTKTSLRSPKNTLVLPDERAFLAKKTDSESRSALLLCNESLESCSPPLKKFRADVGDKAGNEGK